jgi:hypothetical protein
MKLDHFESIWKFEFSNSCALWTIELSLEFFKNYLEPNKATLPKEKVLSIIWSTSVQIFRNLEAQEVIVSSVQI